MIVKGSRVFGGFLDYPLCRICYEAFLNVLLNKKKRSLKMQDSFGKEAVAGTLLQKSFGAPS